MFKPSVALSAVVALACSSCSFIFVHPPHHADDQLTGVPGRCTSSPVAPVVDGVIGTFEVVRTGMALSNSESDYQGAAISRNADIGFGVGFATLFLASSIYGFYETNQCHRPTERVAPPGEPAPAPVGPSDPRSTVNPARPAVRSRPASPEEP